MAQKPTYEELEQRVLALEKAESERKKIEDVLRASEERIEQALQREKIKFTNILRAIPYGVYIVNQTHDIEYVNPVLEKEFGPINGGKCYAYFHNRSERCPWCKNDDVFAGKSVRWEWRSSKNGRSYDLFDTPIENEDGSTSKLEIFIDITDRKRAEEALRENHTKLETALASMTDAVFISDEKGYFINFNDAFASFHRFRSKDECGRTLAEFTDILDVFWPSGEITPLEEWAVPRALRGETVTNAEYTLRRKDTGETWVGSYSFGPIRGKDGEIIGSVVVGRDITDRKKAETEKAKLNAQLVQAQKMESVGRLAGGVAHDYNNMLGVILGYTDLAIEKLAQEDPLRLDLEEVMSAAKRSRDITRQLLAFSRQQTIAPKPLDLNETIESMLKMLRCLIGENIELAWHPETQVLPVYMDPSQIDQILVNLIVNARDAISDVGKITIETDTKIFDEAYCSDNFGFVPGHFVLLSVSDNGCGMDKETIDHLFEPFFTTKEMGKGTGLGLATVYGIVKQNNGFINVYSEPNQGTVFRIYLPRNETAAEPIGNIKTVTVDARGDETILVVEDEKTILKMTQMMLKRLGYTVLTASTPDEAIGLASEYPGAIHLLTTDVVMPEMNGQELASRLQALHPNLKTLFMSGYTANVIAHRGVLKAGVKFIQKPFSKNDLAVKVREALGETTG